MNSLLNGIKKTVTEHPRKTIILAAYFIVGIYITANYGIGLEFLLALLAVTAAVILLNLPDFVAIIGNYNFGKGQAKKAEPFFIWAIAHKTKSPSAHLYYATYLLRLGKAEEAAELLKTAATLNPNIIAAKKIRLTQASCQWVLGDVDGAIDILERMRRTYDYVNASVLATMGYMYYLKDDMYKAEEYTQKAIEDSQDSHAAWDNLGQIRYKQGDPVKAKEAFEKAVSFKENLPDSLYYLGLIARDEGNNEKARECFKKALDCEITALNTVSKEQIEKEFAKYGLH